MWVSTSVLWQWLLIGARGITGGAEPYVQALLLYSVLAVAFLFIVYKQWNRGRYFLLAVLLMAGSNIVIDYTSSGLENALVYVLVAVMWAMVARGAHLQWIALAFGVGILVRHDMAVLFGPVMAFLWVQHAVTRDWRKPETRRELLVAAALSLAPLVLWSTFAWWYYDHPLPHAATTKSGRFFGPYWPHYWFAFFLIDSWGVLVLLLMGSALVAWKGGTRERLLVAGIVFYCVYISVAQASYDPFAGRNISWCLVLLTLLVVDRIRDLVPEVRLWAACGVVAAGMVLWGTVLGAHTPIFPAYNPWAVDFSTIRLLKERPQTHRDGRYWSLTSSFRGYYRARTGNRTASQSPAILRGTGNERGQRGDGARRSSSPTARFTVGVGRTTCRWKR